MRTKQIIVITALSMFAILVLGQTNTNSIPVPNVPGVKGEGTSLLLAIIPLVVPLLVAAAKTGINLLPKWSLPILAASFGELLNYLSGFFGGPSTTVINGVILGAAGTGLREILDQVNKARKGDSEPPANT